MESHEPFQSYFFKYETIVSRNGLSLGYSERDTSSVEGMANFIR